MVSAFLNGNIDTEIYLQQPEWFHLLLGDYSLLHKSLYGLCQGKRVWYLALDGALVEIGFKRLDADLVVWVRTLENRVQFIVSHVDNMLNIDVC